jgi:hypothetical protein
MANRNIGDGCDTVRQVQEAEPTVLVDGFLKEVALHSQITHKKKLPVKFSGRKRRCTKPSPSGKII